MVAYVIYLDGALLTVLDTGIDAAYIGLAYCARAQLCGIGQQSLEELDGNNLLALKHNGIGAQHAYVLKTLHVSKVALAECHEEADSLNAGNVLGK